MKLEFQKEKQKRIEFSQKNLFNQNFPAVYNKANYFMQLSLYDTCPEVFFQEGK